MTETSMFNNKLLKLLCTNDADSEEKDNRCLITNNALEADHIELVCKHKFNYVAIFTEICKQKETTKLESTSLKPNQVKCPYCRNVQMGLIPTNPAYPHLESYGVNIPKKLVYKGNKCMSVIKSGKRKDEICGRKCSKVSCSIHYKVKPMCMSVLCEAKIKTGKRKGLLCGARCIKECNKVNKKCSRHIEIFKI